MTSIPARLAAATGPDRELDGEIAKIEGWTCEKRKGDAVPYWRSADARFNWLRQKDGPPKYTGSLDEVVVLIERLLPWHRWLIDKRPFAASRQDGYRATVYRQAHPYQSDGSDTPQAWAPTPALALLQAMFAALDAKAALAKPGPGAVG